LEVELLVEHIELYIINIHVHINHSLFLYIHSFMMKCLFVNYVTTTTCCALNSN
jgi:hypothetical protein